MADIPNITMVLRQSLDIMHCGAIAVKFRSVVLAEFRRFVAVQRRTNGFEGGDEGAIVVLAVLVCES